MSFHTYAKDTRVNVINGAAWLYATLATGLGPGTGSEGDGYNKSYIRLDDKIGNDHGQFTYPGEGFSTFAKNVRLLEDTITLGAELGTGGKDGGYNLASVDLNKIVQNANGVLKWK